MLNNELFPREEFTLDQKTLWRIQNEVRVLCSGSQAGTPPDRVLFHRFMDSPVGPMIAMASEKGVVLLEFLDTMDMVAKEIDQLRSRYGYCLSSDDHPHLASAQQQLEDYFGGRRQQFTLPLDAPGTPFDVTVWAHLQRIPFGRTCSYGDLAKEIGQGAHARIVGSANHRNRISIVIPCHRVIGADGSLTGYGGGLPRKRWLLEFESLHARDTGMPQPHVEAR